MTHTRIDAGGRVGDGLGLQLPSRAGRILDAGEAFRREDGSYRSENSFQVAGAVPGE